MRRKKKLRLKLEYWHSNHNGCEIHLFLTGRKHETYALGYNPRLFNLSDFRELIRKKGMRLR
jgi:hypothetical protein